MCLLVLRSKGAIPFEATLGYTVSSRPGHYSELLSQKASKTVTTFSHGECVWSDWCEDEISVCVCLWYACSCMFTWVIVGMHMPRSLCGSRRITMGISPRLPPYLRQGLLLFAALCPRDAGWREILVLYSPSPHKIAGVTSKSLVLQTSEFQWTFVQKLLGKYMDMCPPSRPAQWLDLQSTKQWW